MKIAVSVPDELFERADEAANRLGLSRSQVYARALEMYLDEHGDDPVTAALDELAEEFGPSTERAAARRLVDDGAWAW